MDKFLQICRLWFVDIVANLSFFTRIPIPKSFSNDDLSTSPDFTRIPRAFPFVGAIIGLPALIVFPVLTYTALPEFILATLTVVYLTLVCGAFHEDGLSDSADGFYGGTSPQQRLEIMNDSRVGSFGVLALVFSVLLRVMLLTEVLSRTNGFSFALVLIAMASASRATSLWNWVAMPSARPDGLASRFGTPSKEVVWQANVVGLILVLPVIFVFSLVHVILAIGFCLVFALALGKVAKIKIGGQTGDVMGATQQVAEIGFLIGLLLING